MNAHNLPVATDYETAYRAVWDALEPCNPKMPQSPDFKGMTGRADDRRELVIAAIKDGCRTLADLTDRGLHRERTRADLIALTDKGVLRRVALGVYAVGE